MTGPGELSTRKFSNLNFPAVACPAEIIASWYYRRRLCSCDSQVETHSFSVQDVAELSLLLTFFLFVFEIFSIFSSLSFLLFISRVCLTHKPLLFVRFLLFTSGFLSFSQNDFYIFFFIIYEYIPTTCVLCS